jgi:hypothetical protein
MQDHSSGVHDEDMSEERADAVALAAAEKCSMVWNRAALLAVHHDEIEVAASIYSNLVVFNAAGHEYRFIQGSEISVFMQPFTEFLYKARKNTSVIRKLQMGSTMSDLLENIRSDRHSFNTFPNTFVVSHFYANVILFYADQHLWREVRHVSDELLARGDKIDCPSSQVETAIACCLLAYVKAQAPKTAISFFLTKVNWENDGLGWGESRQEVLPSMSWLTLDAAVAGYGPLTNPWEEQAKIEADSLHSDFFLRLQNTRGANHVEAHIRRMKVVQTRVWNKVYICPCALPLYSVDVVILLLIRSCPGYEPEQGSRRGQRPI